ncbi:YncE family protein [Polaribacter sp.]|uniref:YncE family protein n=1 Tax=Polaribacter sp. TaxID=1920175 RepID=UPI00404893E9
MKRLKYFLLFFGVLFFLFRVAIFIVRLPSYSIKTNGKLYIVNKVSECVQVFDLNSGKEIGKISIDMLSHEAVKTADEHKIVLTDFGDTDKHIIKTINTKTNRLEKEQIFIKKVYGNGIIALPEKEKVAVIDYVSNELIVINIENDSIEKQISTEQEKSHLAVLHPNKPIAYVTNINSNSISVIDLTLNKVIKIIVCGLGRKGIDITPDGTELWVTNINENLITVINTTNYQITNKLRSGNESLKLSFSVDGKFCFVANATDGTISIFNQQTKKNIKTIYLHGKTTFFERILYHTPRPVNILMHPNGLYAFVSNSNANKIEVIDMKTFKIVSTIGTGKVPDAMVFIN